MKFDLAKLVPWRPIPTGTIGRFLDAVASLSGLHLSAPLEGSSNTGGRQWRDGTPESFEAMLTGSTSPYGFNEIYRDITTTPPAPMLLLGGRSGTSNAHEYNAAAGLDGKVAVLEPVGDTWYKFAYPRQGPADHPPPCVFTVTVLDAGTDSPISGVTITIADYLGAVACSGTTDSIGVYTCTLTTGIPAFPTVTASYGGCSYTGPIYCNEPLTLYECQASIAYQAIDDGGGDIGGGITYYATPLGSGASVLSMTGGSFHGGGLHANDWASTTPGTAVFCWFATFLPNGGSEMRCPPASIGAITTANIAPACPPGTVGASGNSTYWESCRSAGCAACGTNPPFNPVYWRRSLWLAGPCCANGCVDEHGAIPKSLCGTYAGPTQVLGSDAGVSLPLDWVTSSWDGDCTTAGYSTGFGVGPNPMLFRSACRANGAGGYCYTYNSTTGATTTGAFVPYGSSRAELALFPYATGGCGAIASYQNFWGAGCPDPDITPTPCGFLPCNDGQGLPVPGGCPYYPIPPLYCPYSLGPDLPGQVAYHCQYPMGFSFSILGPGDTIFGTFHGCEPFPWTNATGGTSAPWVSCCTNPYDPSYGQTSSCVIDACGAPAPVHPIEVVPMMMARTRAMAPVAPPVRPASLAGGPFPRPTPAPGKVRLGMLCPCLHKGGAESWQLALLHSLDAAKFAWMGCAVINGPGAVDADMAAAHGEHLPVAPGRGAARALAAACDVLLCWAVEDIDGLVAGPAHPPKVVAVSHSSVDSPWGVEANAASSAGVDRWVAVSELAVGAIGRGDGAGVSVIWNAVDACRLAVGRSSEVMRRSWGVPPGALVAGYLGRLSLEKDPHAMARLAGSLPEPWHAVVVGDGAERPAIDAAAKANRRLHVVGGDPAAGDVLDAFDVLVVPSEYESFGLTLAEGLWMGVPVVATPAGLAKLAPGLVREILVDADGPTLALAVIEAHASGPMAGSREFALGRLSLDRFGREWGALLAEVAGPRPAPSRPGLASMAIDFGRATIAHAADGFREASPDAQAERERLCHSCPNHDHAKDSCKACGCGVIGALSFVGIDLKLRRKWASSRCPLATPRWTAEPIPTTYPGATP